jgi:hypothetical protein
MMYTARPREKAKETGIGKVGLAEKSRPGLKFWPTESDLYLQINHGIESPFSVEGGAGVYS